MRKIIITIAILATISVGAVSYATFALQPATQPSVRFTEHVLTPPTQQELLDAVNAERAKVGVAPLVLQATLTQSAQYKADDMQTRNYTAHKDPVTGKNNGIRYFYSIDPTTCRTVGENYYYATGDLRTVRDSVAWWMNSKLHHDAILDPTNNTTGFGISWGDKMIIVEHFCKL